MLKSEAMKKLTFKTYSLGCRVNQAETEQISEELVKNGFIPNEVPLSGTKWDSSLVLINTCVVTQKAERETRKEIRRLRRENPQAFLVILGCGVDAREKLKSFLPQADLFIPNQNKKETVNLILQKISGPISSGDRRVVKNNNRYFLSGRKFVKIQDGCQHYCTYCIVPFLRGKPQSDFPEDIIEQIKDLEKNGIKEVILTGVNLSLYGKDLTPPTSLVSLIEKVLKETKIEMISLSSLDPQTLDESLTKLIITNPRISRYLHFSLQSGSSTVLSRMHRKVDFQKFLSLVQSIKLQIPHFVFRADIIAGFPDETEKEFNETLQIIKQLPLTFAHVFPYSPRPQTLAFEKIKKGEWQDLPKAVKKERVLKVLAETKNSQKEMAQKLTGQTLDCLIIRKLEDNLYEALSNNSWKVFVQDEANCLKPGTIRGIKIKGDKNLSLTGTILPED